MKHINRNMASSIWRFLTPIIYLFVWILLVKFAVVLGLPINASFLGITLIILFLGILSKSTSWSIGHEKLGIKGDSTSKKVEFCADGVGTIKIFEDDLAAREKLMKEAGKIIKDLKK